MRRLALLGIGNMRLGPITLAAVASFYGERPLEVLLWDADLERLDLMERLGWSLFRTAESPHALTIVETLEDALEVDAAIVLVGRWCVQRAQPDATREEFVSRVVQQFPPTTSVLRLVPTVGERHEDSLDLELPVLSELERQQRAFQTLRWIHGDEPIGPLLEQGESSLIRHWLTAWERNQDPG